MGSIRKAPARIIFLSAILTVVLSFFVVQRSYAYLDPGIGSYSFQILIAGLMTFLFSIGVLKNKFMSLFRKDLSETNERENSSPLEMGDDSGESHGEVRGRND